MIVRIWRTGVRPERAKDYEQFATTRSLPMFRRQDGCLGVLFAEEFGERIVVTLWEGPEAVDRLAESADYRQTVEALSSTGILDGGQSVRVYDVRRIRRLEGRHQVSGSRLIQLMDEPAALPLGCRARRTASRSTDTRRSMAPVSVGPDIRTCRMRLPGRGGVPPAAR